MVKERERMLDASSHKSTPNNIIRNNVTKVGGETIISCKNTSNGLTEFSQPVCCHIRLSKDVRILDLDILT